MCIAGSRTASIVCGMILLFAGAGRSQVPHVVSVSPLQNRIEVVNSTAILASFDVGMNGATLSNSSIVVTGSISGLHLGTISYNAGSHTVTIQPVAPFLTGEVVTAALTPGIQSSGGVPLTHAFIWQFTVRAGLGSGRFTVHADYDAGDSTYGLATGDMTGDGRLDLVGANAGSNTVTVIPGLGDGSFGLGMSYATGTKPMAVKLADLDRDGDLDLAVANSGSNSVSILKNNGSGIIISNVAYSTSSGPRALCVADFDGDGDPDIATANNGDGTTSILWNNGLGSFPTRLDFNISGLYGSAKSVAAADMDNDGDLDLITMVPLHYYPNDGIGGFGTPVIAAGPGVYMVYPADVNGDGWMDLVGAGNGPDAVIIDLNLGNGTFNTNEDGRYYIAGYPNAVVAADFQRDGDLDVASACSWTSEGHVVSTLINDGAGAYTDRVDHEVDFGPFDIVAADFNGDLSMDIATANIATGSISVLLNLCCSGTRGNVNSSGIVDSSDLAALVSYLTSGGYVLPCSDAANVNGIGIVDSADLAAIVSYLTGGGFVLPSCP